jgi:hypothetical protein
MSTEKMGPKPGDTVVLVGVPPGMLDNLPVEDQQAMKDALGKPVLLNEYDDTGRAKLEFKDLNGLIHFIYVHLDFIRAANQS